MDFIGNLVFFLVMLVVINLGAIVRLRFFSEIPWKILKWVLVVANVTFMVFYIIYFFILRKG